MTDTTTAAYKAGYEKGREELTLGGLRVVVSPAVPDDEVWIAQDGKVTGRITDIAAAIRKEPG